MKATIAAAALTLVVLAAPSATAQEISGSKQVCLSTPGGPFTLCTFQTIAQCQQATLPGANSRCVDRSQLDATVGSGSSSPPSGNASPPAGDAGKR